MLYKEILIHEYLGGKAIYLNILYKCPNFRRF